MRVLEFRRSHQELFHNGTYVPLEASHLNQHVCAFARIHEGKRVKQAAIIAVPRLSYTLMGGKPIPPVEHIWGEAAIKLPDGVPEDLSNVLTGKRLQTKKGSLLCRDIFDELPVCVLAN